MFELKAQMYFAAAHHLLNYEGECENQHGHNWLVEAYVKGNTLLTYPERFDCGLKPLDFEKLGAIRFLPLERKKFPCFDLALTAAEKGGAYPCVLNAAGEIAVRAFLDGALPFTAIAKTIEDVLSSTAYVEPTSYEGLKTEDQKARALAREMVKKYQK